MKISVITVAFNAAATIADTIRSVKAQSWQDYEHLIIDGLSADETTTVVDAHKHDRLAMISEPDNGCYDAMNKGLRMASGDVVVFLNADDILARVDVLQLVAGAFKDGNADCVGGQTVVVDRHDLRRVRRLYRSVGYRPWMLSFGHMPPHPSFYARRDLLVQAGGFDTRYRIAADFDLVTRIMDRPVRFIAVPETLAVFREGGISTRDLSARMHINKEIRDILRRNGKPSSAPRLWARYPAKALQFLRRPADYPANMPPLA